jgi:hypothetical protein
VMGSTSSSFRAETALCDLDGQRLHPGGKAAGGTSVKRSRDGRERRSRGWTALEEGVRLDGAPAQAERPKAGFGPLDERGVLTDRAERTQREGLDVSPQRERGGRLRLDVVAIP